MRTVDRQIMKYQARKYCHNRLAKARDGVYPLANLFLFITMRCNAKCDHCFCWQDLNIGIREMTLEELGKIAASVPRFETLILTGGEPMLRRDLPEVCRLFAQHRGPDTIKINTNGLDVAKIEALGQSFTREFPNVGMTFQVSIDGLEETHDRIRGVPGCWRKAVASLHRISELRRTVPNLACEVLTVVNAMNYKELVDLSRCLKERVAPDLNQGFELMRDVNTTAWNIPREIKETDVSPKKMDLPPVEAFPEIAESYRTILREAPYHFSPYYIHNVAQLRMVETGQRQYPCRVAGEAVGVIYSNGDVAACEFTVPFTNLAEYDYDFKDCWSGEKAVARRAQLGGCHCIHGSFHGKATEYSLGALAATTRAAFLAGRGK